MTGLEFGRDASPPLELLLERGLWIRAVDLELAQAALERRDPILNETVLHSSLGQELASVAVGLLKSNGDVATSTHRGFAHSLGWGLDARSVVAECVGREAGYAFGRGGHMHIISPSEGFLGTNGIVGGGLTIAVGAAEALRMAGTENIAFAYTGDGAVNTGAFGESLNLAGVWGAPVLFLVENNGWSEYTQSAVQLSSRSIVERAVGYDIAAISVHVADATALFSGLKDAVEHVRSGQGPMLVEVRAPRIGGHWVGDAQPYRAADDLNAALTTDPLIALARQVGSSLEDFETALTAVRADAARLVADVLAQPGTGRLEPSNLTKGMW